MELIYILIGAVVGLLGWNKVKSIQLDNERDKVEELERYKDSYEHNQEQWEIVKDEQEIDNEISGLSDFELNNRLLEQAKRRNKD